MSQFLHVGFVLVNKHCPVFFFRWFAPRFREKTYAKNSVFLAASFGDLLLNEKQKKPFVSLNNEVSVDFLKVARLLLFEWTWRERLLSLAARQIYSRNFPPVALSNQNQRYESTRQSSQIITRSRAKLFKHTTLALR